MNQLNFLRQQELLSQTQVGKNAVTTQKRLVTPNNDMQNIFPTQQDVVATNLPDITRTLVTPSTMDKDTISIFPSNDDEFSVWGDSSDNIFYLDEIPSLDSGDYKVSDLLDRKFDLNVKNVLPKGMINKILEEIRKMLEEFFGKNGLDPNSGLKEEPTKEELQEKLDGINESIDEKKSTLDKIYSGEYEPLNELEDVANEKYEDYKTALTENNPELAEQIFGLEDKINEYDKKIDNNKKQMLAAQTKMETLGAEIEDLTAEKDEIQNQINELLFSSNIANKLMGQEELSAKLEELFDKKQQIEDQIAEKKQEKRILQMEMGVLQQGINHLIVQKGLATDQRKALEEQIPADATDVHSAKDGYYTAKDEYKNAKKEAITTTETELEKLEAEKAQVEKDLDAKEAEENKKVKDPSKMTVDELKAKISELESEKAVLERELRSLLITNLKHYIGVNPNDNRSERIAELQEKIKNIDSDILMYKSYLREKFIVNDNEGQIRNL